MKILTIDLETAPNIGDAWQLWNTTISLNQLRQSAYTLCWAAKWHGSKEVFFGSVWNDNISGAYDLLDEADATITYNGDHFDRKILNKDIALSGLGPPSSSESIDLLKVVKKNFRFPSNKLEHISKQFGVGSKMSHEGHSLWVKVMAGDPSAQKKMQKYCEQDVRVTENLYDRLLPWISNHPNRQLYVPGSKCTRCAKGSLTKAGFRYTQVAKYQTYRCNSCGGRSSDTTRDEGVSVRSI